MNRIRLGVFLAVWALGSSGCGLDLSKDSQSQQDLPDAGLWMCRLDFAYSNPTRIEDLIVDYGQSRTGVKDEITRSCLGSFTARMEGCSAAINRNDFRCVHESQIAAPADQAGVWRCQLNFSFNDGAGSRTDTFASNQSSRSAAIEEIFAKCATTYLEKKIGCSNAILNNALVCSVM